MTTRSYAANSILAYMGADADVVGVSGTVCLPYWDGASVYFFQTNQFGSPGIRKFDIDADGDETLQRSKASIGTNWTYAGPYGSAATLSYDGSYIFYISDPGNSSQAAKVQASDLTLVNTQDVASNNLDPALGLLSPYQFSGALYGSTSWLFSTTGLNIGNAHNDMYALDGDNFVSRAQIGPPDEHGTGNPCISRHGITSGPIYVIAPPVANDGAGSPLATGIYSLTPPLTKTKIGTFLPTDIDATWTNIVSWRGVCYDESDGNLIIGVQTTDAGPTNKTYIAKLSATTGAVMWVRAVNALTAYSQSFTNSRVRNGTFHYIGSASLVYHITTSSGALASSETFTGLVVSGPQVSDDVTNSVICYGNFTAGASPPDYLGTYMGTGGHHSISSAWFRAFFATTQPTENPGDIGGLALSARRAWTFTLDGHVFYVLDLDTEGTYLIDLTTEQWCKFVTSGFSRWNMQNGVMWGTRVVGGSIDLPIVWEASATALDDDGDDIAHVITGGTQTRSRTKHSVGAVRLTGSANKLGAATSSMRLRFSDDNGDSWSGYKTISLTQGTVKEMAWRSLGAFAAPGRIFEFSDTGGPVRLDGVDADIEGLEEDGPS